MNTHTHLPYPRDLNAQVWTTESHNGIGDKCTVNWMASDSMPLAPQFDNIERQQNTKLAELLAYRGGPS